MKLEKRKTPSNIWRCGSINMKRGCNTDERRIWCSPSSCTISSWLFSLYRNDQPLYSAVNEHNERKTVCEGLKTSAFGITANTRIPHINTPQSIPPAFHMVAVHLQPSQCTGWLKPTTSDGDIAPRCTEWPYRQPLPGCIAVEVEMRTHVSHTRVTDSCCHDF